MKWFRFYSSAVSDPKVQRLTPIQFKAWVNLLCLASGNEPRGALPVQRDMAYHLRLPPKTTQRVVDQLVAAGFLDRDPDSNDVRVHHWDKWQFESDVLDPSSSDRKERWRERKRNGMRNGEGTVPVRGGDAPDPEAEQRQIQNRSRGRGAARFEPLSGGEF